MFFCWEWTAHNSFTYAVTYYVITKVWETQTNKQRFNCSASKSQMKSFVISITILYSTRTNMDVVSSKDVIRALFSQMLLHATGQLSSQMYIYFFIIDIWKQMENSRRTLKPEIIAATNYGSYAESCWSLCAAHETHWLKRALFLGGVNFVAVMAWLPWKLGLVWLLEGQRPSWRVGQENMVPL